MSEFKVSRIHHASFIVNDINKALYFYQTILGLNVDPHRPDLGFPGAWLNIGGQQIHLLELPNPDIVSERPAHGGRDRHLALNVTNIEPLQERFKEYEITYTLSQSGRKALFCRDPDENTLEFIDLGLG
jgi:glyoxylase I family protein